MARAKRSKKYVLFGCPCSIDEHYAKKGYIGVADGKICLVEDQEDAMVYDFKLAGHGAPKDWMKLFKEDYGLDVHPVYLRK